jgi:hypothetical protein
MVNGYYPMDLEGASHPMCVGLYLLRGRTEGDHVPVTSPVQPKPAYHCLHGILTYGAT